MQHLVGHTRNNIEVYVNLISSKAAKHIAREPHLLTLISEALRDITLKPSTTSIEHDMKRVIGYDFVVPTTSTDNVFYAQLVKDNIYTRFVKNGKPTPTTHISILLDQNDDGSSYGLLDAWIGHLMPPKPGSDQETDESKSYWESHAFVFENQPVQLRTLTKTYPY